MTTQALKNRIKRRIDKLPEEKLLVAEDFISYLSDREDNEATKELLAIPGILKEVNEAEESLKKAGAKNWRKVRRDV